VANCGFALVQTHSRELMAEHYDPAYPSQAYLTACQYLVPAPWRNCAGRSAPREGPQFRISPQFRFCSRPGGALSLASPGRD